MTPSHSPVDWPEKESTPLNSHHHQNRGSRHTLVGRILQIIYCISVLCILVPFGSVDAVPAHLFSAMLFTVALAAILMLPEPRQTRLAFRGALLIAVLLASWALVQGLDIPGNPLANDIWRSANDYFGPMPQTISVAPGDTIQAIIPLTLPFIAFLAGLVLFSTDTEGLRLIRFLCLSGIAVAGFGLLQFSIAPQTLLWEQKHAYLDSLTAVFVNRNTAATFLGVTLILACSLFVANYRSFRKTSFIGAILGDETGARREDMIWSTLYLLGGVVVLAALMLTKSRAGVFAAGAGLALCLVLFAGFGAFSDHRTASGKRTAADWRRVLVVFAFLGFVAALFSGQVFLRATVQGTEDARFCVMPGMLRLLSDNWVLGTGLGTFRDAFSAYRDPACGTYGVWHRAHNVYLEGFITLGIVFPIAATMAIVLLASVLIRGLRTRKRYRWAPIAGLGILSIILLHSTVDFSLQIPGFAVFSAAAMAGLVTISSNRRADGLQEPNRQQSG